jgi:riboflavin kinase/FMN adenylyltransferase
LQLKLRRKVLIIHTDIEKFIATNPVVTIGTFDGVHLGHRRVIDQLNELAGAIHGESVLFTFYPHPRLVVSKDDSQLKLITTLNEKTALLEQAGIDHLVIFPFTKEFASLSYEEFIQSILIDKLKMHTLVVGYDHKLGKNREGSFDNIIKLSKKSHFVVEKINTFLINEVAISSSKIRNALNNGEIETANKYLGYPFSIEGTVIQGTQMGRKLGFPTANIITNDKYKIVPTNGVYTITIEVAGKIHQGMLNIGNRPTINNNKNQNTIEAHIFDFDRDIYQQKIRISIHHRVREEIKFNGIEALITQLEKDKEHVKQLLSSLK